MNSGKEVCKRLKAVRKAIAQANDINYEPTECKYEGDCLGTCPKCEEEVRYIENELNKRSKLGKTASIVGIAAGILGSAGLSSCAQPVLWGDPLPYPEDTINQDTANYSIKNCVPLRGKVTCPEDQPEVLMGDVQLPPDDSNM